MAELFTNNGASTLATTITTGSTSVVVGSGHGARFPNPSSPDYFYVTLDDGTNVEIVKVTARSTDTLTVTRAQQGTAAFAFTSGAKVENRLTTELLTAVSGQTIYEHLRPELAQPIGSAFPSPAKAGTNFPVFGLAYDSSANESAAWTFIVPRYAAGNISVRLFWYADTASANDVVWGASLAAITPDTDTQDVETKSLATENTVTDTHLGTTGQRLHQCTIAVTNLDSIAAGDFAWLKIKRLSAGNTLTGDALLIGAQVSYAGTP